MGDTTLTTLHKVNKIVEQHYKRRRKAVEYNRKYRHKTKRAREGHRLRNRKSYYIKRIQDYKENNRDNIKYLHHCAKQLDEAKANLISLGFKG